MAMMTVLGGDMSQSALFVQGGIEHTPRRWCWSDTASRLVLGSSQRPFAMQIQEILLRFPGPIPR